MGNPLSRRAVISGATAFTAALALPTIASAGSPGTFETLIHEWQELEAIIQSEGKAIDDLEISLRKSAPKLPALLKQSVTVPEGKPIAPDSEHGWTLEALERLIAESSYDVTVRHDMMTGFVIGVSSHPLPFEALETFKSMRNARLAYDAAIESHYADHAARQADWESMVSEQDVVLRAIVESRPADWPELYRKADWLHTSGALKRNSDCSDYLGLASNFAADILAIPSSA